MDEDKEQLEVARVSKTSRRTRRSFLHQAWASTAKDDTRPKRMPTFLASVAGKKRRQRKQRRKRG